MGILRMRSAQCVVDYCAERIRRCAPVGFGCSDFVQQLQACRHRTTAVEYTHARVHACTGRRRLSARTLSASAHRSAAACAAACRAPSCCAASRRRAMTAHSQQGPSGRHMPPARVSVRSPVRRRRVRTLVFVRLRDAWCHSKAQHSQGGQAAQGCAVPGGTRGELRLIKFVAVRCNRMRHNASHQAVQVGQSVPAQMWASPGADNGQLVPAQMWRRCNPNTLGEKGMAAARRVTEDH
jgi:hypothetical protein